MRKKFLILAIVLILSSVVSLVVAQAAQTICVNGAAPASSPDSTVNFSLWFANNSNGNWISNGTQLPSTLTGKDGVLLEMFYFGEGGADSASTVGSGPYIVQNDGNAPVAFTVSFLNANFPSGMQVIFQLSGIGYMNTPNYSQIGIVNSTTLGAGQTGVLFPAIIVESGTPQNPDPYGGQPFSFSFDIAVSAATSNSTSTSQQTIHVTGTVQYPGSPSPSPSPSPTPQSTASPVPQTTASPLPESTATPPADPTPTPVSNTSTDQQSTITQTTTPTSTPTPASTQTSAQQTTQNSNSQTTTNSPPETQTPAVVAPQSYAPEYPTAISIIILLIALTVALPFSKKYMKKQMP